MINLSKSLPRRTFLRGAGAVVALPFLDAMAPAGRAATSSSSGAPRVAFFGVPNGMYLPNFHPAGNGGTDYAFTPILKPLEPLRDKINVFSGLSNRGLISSKDGGGPHTRSMAGWLSGVLPKRTEGSDIQAAKTMDQYAADKIGTGTSLRSLELTTESNFQVGNCENGYSCSYLNCPSWRTDNTPLPPERDPRAVFQRLFGESGSASARMAQLKQDRSILDAVAQDMKRLEARLGSADRRMVSDYLDAVREIEARIQRTEKNNANLTLPVEEVPLSVPEQFDEHAKLLMDLLHLAFQGDIVRVSTFQIARELSPRSYPWIGVPEAHHSVSHHQNSPRNIEPNTKINAYHVSLFARFIDKLAKTPDGDGTLLDRSVLVYGSALGDGDQHSPINLPLITAGNANGQLKSGRHIRYELNTPLMNVGLSLLGKVGVDVENLKLGDSTGVLTDL
jgi:hypothetical protein